MSKARPSEADHRLWEPPRDSPVPPQGATNRRPAPEVVLQCNPPPFREEDRQLVTPPGANPGVPARQAHPTRRPRGTQHPHGCQLPPSRSAHARRAAERDPPARPCQFRVLSGRNRRGANTHFFLSLRHKRSPDSRYRRPGGVTNTAGKWVSAQSIYKKLCCTLSRSSTEIRPPSGTDENPAPIG